MNAITATGQDNGLSWCFDILSESIWYIFTQIFICIDSCGIFLLFFTSSRTIHFWFLPICLLPFYGNLCALPDGSPWPFMAYWRVQMPWQWSKRQWCDMNDADLTPYHVTSSLLRSYPLQDKKNEKHNKKFTHSNLFRILFLSVE